MKPIILHLGAHKTGTSLIQNYLKDRQRIIEKQKIYAMPRNEGNIYFGWGGQKRLAENLPKFVEDVQTKLDGKFEYYIASHENALGKPLVAGKSGLYPEAAARAQQIKDALKDMETKIVFYIRSQQSFIESYYLQTIHQGHSSQFDEYLKDINLKKVSWRPLVETLQSIFGKENVIIKDFKSELENGQAEFLKSFFKTFMEPNPWKFGRFKYPNIRNPSIGSRGHELALIVNPHLITPAERKKFRVFFQREFSNLNYDRPMLFKDKQNEMLKRLYSEENLAIIRYNLTFINN